MFSARFLRSIQKIQRPEDARRLLRLDRYWIPEVAEALLVRIDGLVSFQPALAAELAEITVELVGRIRDVESALQAHAFCSLAVAQRFLGRLPEAEASFDHAKKLGESGPISLSAMICRHRALLLLDLRKPDDALRLVRKAVVLEREAGVSASRSLICEAVICGSLGDFATCAQLCEEVLEKESPDSPVYLSAVQNLLSANVQRPMSVEGFLEAKEMFRRVRFKLRGIRETPVRYCVWYAEALLHLRMKEFPNATEKLQQARAGFLALSLLKDYALASLDLAKVFARMNAEDRGWVVLERTAFELERDHADPSLREAFRGVSERKFGVEATVQAIRDRIFNAAPTPGQ